MRACVCVCASVLIHIHVFTHDNQKQKQSENCNIHVRCNAIACIITAIATLRKRLRSVMVCCAFSFHALPEDILSIHSSNRYQQ